jgi:hypothetical protein
MDKTAEARLFDIGDVLSITTGCLVSPRLMDGVYDILNYMTGDELFTHQLPRAAQACKPTLLEQFPQLAEVNADEVNPSNHEQWLAAQRAKFGAAFAVTPIGEWVHINPIIEAEAMVGKEKVIRIDV